MKQLATAAAKHPAFQSLANSFPDPLGLDAWLREFWRVVPDPEDVEYIRSPIVQLELYRNLGVFEGDCDDAATLAGAILKAREWPAQFVAIRQAGNVEFSHVWLRAWMPDGHLDIDPIVPAYQLPLTDYAESMEVDL